MNIFFMFSNLYKIDPEKYKYIYYKNIKDNINCSKKTKRKIEKLLNIKKQIIIKRRNKIIIKRRLNAK